VKGKYLCVNRGGVYSVSPLPPSPGGEHRISLVLPSSALFHLLTIAGANFMLTKLVVSLVFQSIIVFLVGFLWVLDGATHIRNRGGLCFPFITYLGVCWVLGVGLWVGCVAWYPPGGVGEPPPHKTIYIIVHPTFYFLFFFV